MRAITQIITETLTDDNKSEQTNAVFCINMQIQRFLSYDYLIKRAVLLKLKKNSAFLSKIQWTLQQNYDKIYNVYMHKRVIL